MREKEEIAELNLQVDFVREVCKTPIPLDQGFKAIYLWGMVNLSPVDIADAVVRMLERLG